MKKIDLVKKRGTNRKFVEAYSCETASTIGNWIAIAGIGILGAGLIIGTGGVAGGILVGYGMAGTITGGGIAAALEIGC